MSPQPATAARNHLEHKIYALVEWSQRVAVFARDVNKLSPELASTLFSSFCIDAATSHAPTAIILTQTAFLSVIENKWDRDHIQFTREAAAAADESVTTAFLWPIDWPDTQYTESDVPIYNTDRELTLGERKRAATIPERGGLEVALADPDPQVTGKVLANPRTTETDVVRLCAKKNVSAAALAKVASNARWRQQRQVLKSLANNKKLPFCFSITLLPFLHRTTLREISHDSRLDPRLREAAFTLLNIILRQS